MRMAHFGYRFGRLLKESERPVGVPAARGHGGDGGAVFEATPGFRVCVFNPETLTANTYAECP